MRTSFSSQGNGFARAEVGAASLHRAVSLSPVSQIGSLTADVHGKAGAVNLGTFCGSTETGRLRNREELRSASVRCRKGLRITPESEGSQ